MSYSSFRGDERRAPVIRWRGQAGDVDAALLLHIAHLQGDSIRLLDPLPFLFLSR